MKLRPLSAIYTHSVTQDRFESAGFYGATDKEKPIQEKKAIFFHLDCRSWQVIFLYFSETPIHLECYDVASKKR